MAAITPFDTLEAICDNIRSRFPDRPIYIMQMPQGFKRPSFYVNLIGLNDRDFCLDGLRRKIVFEIVSFDEQDKKGVVNVPAQLTAYATLLQIFQAQVLKVMDRHIKITSLDGGPRDAEIYLTLSLEYTFTPGKFPGESPEAVYELMQQFFIKYL